MTEDIRLLEGFGGVEMNENNRRIMRKLAKTAFLYPDSDSIRKYDAAANYLYRGDADVPVVVGAKAELSVTKSASTTDYTLTLHDEIPKQTAAVLAEVFGATPTETHATVILIEVPTGDYTKLAVKHGATDYTLAAGDVIEINNRFYLVHVAGLYDNSGTVTATVTAITVTYGVLTVKYAIALSEATLQA